MKEISNTLFSKEIPKDVMELFEGKAQVVDELIRKVAGEHSAWFMKYGGFTKVVHTSYENVMKKLQKEYGPDVTEWKWGDYHQLAFTHPISKSSSMLALFAFNRENQFQLAEVKLPFKQQVTAITVSSITELLGDSSLIRKICQTVIIL